MLFNKNSKASGEHVYLNNMAVSEHSTFTRADSAPLGILSICLKGLSNRGQPPVVLNSMLEGYYIGSKEKNLVFEELGFSIPPELWATWTRQLNKAIDKMLM